MIHDFIVIGGGLVGLATALELQRQRPGAMVMLLEKEPKVACHQSSHNSGVLHSGLYYKPGSLKARLAVRGIRRMVAFCREHSIPHEICGKVVVATDEAEVVRLRELEKRGTANGLRGLRWLHPEGLREVEPHAAGLAALSVPEEGIVDYAAVGEKMRGLFEAGGGNVRTGTRVTALHRRENGWQVKCRAEEFLGKFIINCAGLHSDRVAALTGQKRAARIVPFRGEYYELRPEARHLVKHLIYPVPDPVFPFLGVHYTRMIHGGIEAGPNAVLAFAREGYTKWTVRLGDLTDALGFVGLWRFLSKHRHMAWEEVRRSLSKRLFCASLQRLVPAIREQDLAPGGAGVRAQAMLPDGTLVQDFHFIQEENALHVVNAPSPGATASLAIGEYVSTLALKLTGFPTISAPDPQPVPTAVA